MTTTARQPGTPLHPDHILIAEYEHLSGYGTNDTDIARRLGYTDAGNLIAAVRKARRRT